MSTIKINSCRNRVTVSARDDFISSRRRHTLSPRDKNKCSLRDLEREIDFILLIRNKEKQNTVASYAKYLILFLSKHNNRLEIFYRHITYYLLYFYNIFSQKAQGKAFHSPCVFAFFTHPLLRAVENS